MADLIWWCIFIHLTTRPSADGKRAPLTAISLQAVGSPKEAPPTYIAKMWLLKKIGKNVIFSQNHTETNADDWTITKKTTRTIKHENFSKMKILKVDRWALSLNLLYNYVWINTNKMNIVNRIDISCTTGQRNLEVPNVNGGFDNVNY